MNLFQHLVAYFDSHNTQPHPKDPKGLKTDPMRWTSYIILHAGCIGLFWVGWSWTAVAVAVALYFLRMFAITGFYHRYFSHRTFKTSRFGQFLFAVWGNSATQRGALWWAAQHRKHHAHSDEPEDVHSPVQHGIAWSHMGWLTSRANLITDLRLIPDFAKYRELVFLDRFDLIVPLCLATSMYGLGALLGYVAPSLGTSGLQMLVWGFFVSTVVLFHGTCLVNSAAHLIGSRRFKTTDASRNNFFIALVTMGEGWHNNHHHYPASARQGFYWWEIDLTYYGLKLMEKIGLIWDVRPVPEHVLQRSLEIKPEASAAAKAA